MIQYGDPLEVIHTLLGNPAHAETIIYKPCKVVSDESKENRIYSSVVTPVIIATDKTQLTQFSGSKLAYLVYLTFGNISRVIRRITNSKLSKKEKTSRIQCLFHNSMYTMDMVGGDGKVRRIYPVLAFYLEDYPEQCLVACTKYGTCPKCQSPASELGSNPSGDAKAKSHNLDQFHSLYQSNGVLIIYTLSGIFKHMVTWCDYFLHPSELDARTKSLPPCFELSQISGREHKEMVHIILGCLVGKIPRRVILVYHSLLDFIYLAQYPTHNNHTLGYLQEALDTFYKNKVAFERLHIDFAKKAWRATNKRDGYPQMASWLDRYEKVLSF
ncbi:hypothetical protein EDD22DRAFT_982192 [Suillus occidentalis]|nr:hypothetical protein EDD22DRAFT_982192 [Suillus occidentalis]